MSTALKTSLRHCSLSRPPKTIRSPTCRTFCSSSQRQLALAAPTIDTPGSPVVESRDRDKRELIEELKLHDLEVVLSRNAPHRRVWGCYVDLLNFVRPAKVPLELHQKVLRQCTLPPKQARVEMAKLLLEGSRPRYSHVHEIRFQSIIHNIREAGHYPTLDDYHFILEQFAAVGHHLGAVKVLQEITSFGLAKTPKTYGLCLQALCHRLKLPCYHKLRPHLVVETSNICMKLLNEMWAVNIPFTSVNVDLAIRVLKETLDLEVLQKLLKVAYGIDLAFPDRPPLEFWDQDRTKDVPREGDLASHVPTPQPFSTAALNTTIDVLGRIGNISKLVQAFEVLTTPLPSHAPAVPASSFYDDEDDDFGVSSPAVAPYVQPHATPNTTTYSMLIRWISQAGHATLMRHYLLAAMQYDREVDRKLRGDCLIKPRNEILALHMAVNRNMIMPIFSEANTDKNMELMHWIALRLQRVLRRKRFDLVYYKDIREKWRAEDELESSKSEVEDEVSKPVLEAPTTIPRPSEGAKSSVEDIGIPLDHFDVDLDAPAVPEPPPPKKFNIDLHITILERDKASLTELQKYITHIIGRTCQRIKERLGRRIWADKNVYLRTVKGRTRITRDEWRGIVNYRPERVPLPRWDSPGQFQREKAPHLAPYRQRMARRSEHTRSILGV
ncbi:hypothetical protein NLI96_g5019 [Meripilus lineatus]|uniref:Uncharacterized protein n=1 Tax=Meripilus lineatus TaxID=2056292 RepID=A0AAD5YF57_9APHY|nr:hypothetical protein NLI96_g5019 [Physisporinus lineatus]